MSLVSSRRDVLAGAAAVGLASGFGLQTALAQTAPSAFGRVAEGQRFDFGGLVEVARAVSKRPYAPPVVSDLPEGYATLPYDQYIGIRALPGTVIWAGENRGITIEPIHRGYVFQAPTTIFVVEDGIVRRIGFDRGKFDYGRVAPPPPNLDLGFSGFRISAGNDRPQEFGIAQGPTFFRSMAAGQNFGAISRGLILRPGDTRGEEVPHVRAYWIERPSPQSGVLVIHSLVESESVAAAIRMTMRPGDVTFVDVEQSIFIRNPIDHIGIGGAMASFLYSPSSRRLFDEVRPAVYEVSGLQMLSGAGEWIYRPVNNPATLQVSSFVDSDPRGFGLVQRDREFSHFQDDDQRFEMRPSFWVEPLGDWGPGTVQLLEIPSDNEVNDNIIAYWRPKQAYAAGAEVAFAYRQAWCWYPPERPPLATVTRQRQGRGSTPRRRRWVIDFNGDILADAGVVTGIKANLSATPGGVHNIRLWPYPERKGLRVAFELEPTNEPIAEMRLVLESGGKPVSETWLNRWTP